MGGPSSLAGLDPGDDDSGRDCLSFMPPKRYQDQIVNYRYIAVIALLILIVPGLALLGDNAPPAGIPVEAKAAIIDQLDPSEPNPAFIAGAAFALQNYGCKVDYYQGDQITVDFIRQLPSCGYRIIIFRAHSGLLGTGVSRVQKTCFFTNEFYSQSREIGDQLSERLAVARYNEDPPVFGIRADFIRNNLTADFNQTAVIMMGCSSLESDDLARSFIEKGASVYIGWNTDIGLEFDDDITLSILDNLCCNNLSIQAAVSAAMHEKGPDPVSGAELKYYPQKKGSQTLGELSKSTQ